MIAAIYSPPRRFAVWPRFHTHGYLRGCVEPAVYRYLDCSIFDQGVARVRCPDCQHEFLIAFSCKLRGL